MMVSRGEVWLVDFGRPESAETPEQAKVRPALVVSVDEVNHYGDLAINVPKTGRPICHNDDVTERYGFPCHIMIPYLPDGKSQPKGYIRVAC
ncbi:MAG: type II toxin-antitoxin system PemK/MazF family toxin [Candidatus Xenobia bacterium]